MAVFSFSLDMGSAFLPSKAPHPNPLPLTGAREGPAKREGEGSSLGLGSSAFRSFAGRLVAGALAGGFADACRLAAQAAEVIELRPADIAPAHQLDRFHPRAEEREHALHTFAVGDLAHGEGR